MANLLILEYINRRELLRLYHSTEGIAKHLITYSIESIVHA